PVKAAWRGLGVPHTVATKTPVWDEEFGRMKLPRNFFKPLAIGAPAPLRELPVKLERMIHFVPPHIEKLRAKVPELIAEVDVVLGNLEDAIPADAKQAARAGSSLWRKPTTSAQPACGHASTRSTRLGCSMTSSRSSTQWERSSTWSCCPRSKDRGISTISTSSSLSWKQNTRSRSQS